MNKPNKIFIIAACLLLALSCSKNKNTASSRAFYKFTSNFNTYFNGNESYKEGLKKTEKIYPESFDEILPVFAMSQEKVPNQVAADMDRAISKAQKLITNYSIKAKPERPRSRKMSKEERDFYNKKEFNEKVPEAYMLIAKAQTYMHDFSGASATLEYMESQFPKEPILFESRIWRAIVATEMGDLEDAEKKLKTISRIRNYPKTQHQIYHSAWANLLIKQKKYDEAISRLQKALKVTTKHNVKVRYNFILAQLYSQMGDKENSLKYFTKVSKMTAPYNVRFAAQLGKASCLISENEPDMLKSLYKKMLNDSKNNDFRDQIYYALGNLEKNLGKNLAAIKFYEKSIETNANNTIQLGLSHLALANLFYANDNFVKSYKNYVEAENFLPQKHADYGEIKQKIDILKTLAPNLEIVNTEDSLQNLAKMPEAMRNAVIDSIIDVVKKQKSKVVNVEESVFRNNFADDNMPNNHAKQGGSNSKWYFYNPVQLATGQSDFNMRWGKRKLEDNWRRSNKNTVEFAGEKDKETTENVAEINSEQAKTITPNNMSDETRQYYLQNLPLTAEAMQKSNIKLANALYIVATAYKDDLKNDKLAAKAFEEFISRFPDNEYVPNSYYYLYLLYAKTGETAKSTLYKQKLIQNFPKSVLAKVLSDAKYLENLKKEEKDIENKYLKALDFYHENKNSEALEILNNILSDRKVTEIMPRIEMLKILATNYSGNELEYRKSLENIASKYPDNEVGKAAKQMIKTLDETDDTEYNDENEEPEIPQNAKYENNEKSKQYVALIVENTVDINAILFDIAGFNADFYLNENVESSAEIFDKNHKIILIKYFDNKRLAQNYYNMLMSKSDFIKKLANSDYLYFIITPENLNILNSTRNIVEYMKFFEQNY